MASNKQLNRILNNISGDISKGYSLAAAFKKYPRIFNSLFTTMVEAGEETGNLGASFRKIADYVEKSVHLRRRIKSASIYPAAIVSFIMFAFMILFVFLVPRITKVYVAMGAELPVITRLVIEVSEMLISGFHVPLMLIIVFLLSGWLMYRNKQSRFIIDSLVLRVPFFGLIMKKALLARLFYTMSTLLDSGIDIAHALDTSSGVTGNMYIYQVFLQIRTNILIGSTLTEEFGNYNLFPEMAVKMTGVGESTGEMAEVFLKVAEYYTSEVDEAVLGASSMLEPMIIIMLSVLVGLFVVSMYLPIFSLAMTMIGGG